jgi:four helix bundle protein
MSLDKGNVAQIIGRQMLRSGTSVGAHHREASRARSVAEFVSKMETGLQELDETAYWLELLIESHLIPARRLAPLMDETEQLVSIFVASVKTSKLKRHY